MVRIGLCTHAAILEVPNIVRYAVGAVDGALELYAGTRTDGVRLERVLDVGSFGYKYVLIVCGVFGGTVRIGDGQFDAVLSAVYESFDGILYVGGGGTITEVPCPRYR